MFNVLLLVYLTTKYYLQADKKFYGEFEGLRALRETKTVMAPRPIATGLTIDKSNHLFVLEYLNLTSLNEKSTIKLGRQIADLHLFNFQQNSSCVIIQFFRICFFNLFIFHRTTLQQQH